MEPENAAKAQGPPAGRLHLLIALLALELSAVAAFGRVLQGSSTTAKLVAAGAVSVLLAWALERRHVLLSAAVSAVALLLTVGLVVFPDTLRWLWIPTTATFRAIHQSFVLVSSTAAVQTSPALPLRPLLLATITAVWAAGFSSHALAARARSPFLSLLPPAALVGFASIVMQDGARPGYVLPFLIASLAVIFADALWRVGQWGPMTMWHGRRPRRLNRGTTGRAARRVAAVCVAIALFVPGILPGFHSRSILDLEGRRAPPRVSVNPILDVRPQLLQRSNIQVFTVRTDPPGTPLYWQVISVDRFDGQLWTTADPDGSTGAQVGPGPAALLGLVPLGPSAVTKQVTQTITFEQTSQPQIPAAFNPVQIDLPGDAIRYDPRSNLLFDPNGTRSGLTYRVVSQVPTPSPAQLDAVTSFVGVEADPYLRLPRGTPKAISTLAHRIADPQPTIYRKILAIQNYLRDNYRYSLSVPPGHTTNEILRFLTVTRAGYCVQFASAMGILLRTLGIPTRLAIGYTPGEYDAARRVWRVSTRDAHVWVQVLFPIFGWVPFDPTPTVDAPGAAVRIESMSGYTDPPPAFVGGSRAGAGTNQPCWPKVVHGAGTLLECVGPKAKQSIQPTVAPTSFSGETGGGGNGRKRASARPGSRPVPWVVWLVVALLGAAALAIPGTKVVRRRLALARARAPRDRVLAAFDLLAARAADVGLSRRAAETMLEYRTRLKREVATLDGDLDVLTRLAGRAAYSSRPMGREEAHQAMEAARRAAHEMLRSAGSVRRVAGWFRVEVSSRR